MGGINHGKFLQEFQKSIYDICFFSVPKGKKEIIKKHWKHKGYISLNAYVNDLINKDMSERKVSKKIYAPNNHGIVIGRDNKGIIYMR